MTTFQPGRWQDAAFAQESVLRALGPGGYFAKLCDGYQQSAYGEGVPEGLLSSLHRSMMQRAEPMYVSDDAFTLWERASETFEPEALQRTDVVCPAGFALLPRPFRIDEVAGRSVAFRAIAWVPVSTNPNQRWNEGEDGVGLWVSLLSHMGDTDDVWQEDPELLEAARRDGIEWTLMHAAPMTFGERPWEGPGFTEGESATVKGLMTIIQSFWRLSSQLVAVPSALPRQWRKQRERQQLVKNVVIVRLRRPSTHVEHEGDGRDYSHQWIVHGHWRNQYYPSLGSPEDPGSHRQIWISPYVKGPEDKPLIVKERAWEWTR